MRTIGTVLGVLSVAAVAGCAEPLHLGYDFGRAFTQAVVAQGDLTRPSIANERYVLYGIEGTQIRLNVAQETTETETGQSELETGSE